MTTHGALLAPVALATESLPEKRCLILAKPGAAVNKVLARCPRSTEKKSGFVLTLP
jgi:hypothetical protein